MMKPTFSVRMWKGNSLILMESFWKNEFILLSIKKIIAESFPKESGSFVLAGPYDKGVYKLQLKDFKIKSFSTDTQGCKISNDSLSIEIPDGVTYVIFNDITLK